MRIQDLVDRGAQFLIATRSPVPLAVPNARIMAIAADGTLDPVPYDDALPYAPPAASSPTRPPPSAHCCRRSGPGDARAPRAAPWGAPPPCAPSARRRPAATAPWARYAELFDPDPDSDRMTTAG